MPEKKVVEKARRDAAEGKSPSVQAGEFVREEMRHIREGKHGARSTQQAIAIGLSEARRAGVKLPPPKAGRSSPEVRKKAEQDLARAGKSKAPSRKRAQATEGALKREGSAAASRKSLSRQARTAALRRTASERSASAQKAVATNGPEERSAAVKKAARTRKRKA